MDLIIPIVLLVLGVPIVTGIWLIARAIKSREEIEALSRRVTELQVEVARLGKSAHILTETKEEKLAQFTTATLPPRKDMAPPPVPAAPAKPMAAPKPIAPVETMPVETPVLPAIPPPVPEALSSKPATELVQPPPLIPPLPQPEVKLAEAEPEAVSASPAKETIKQAEPVARSATASVSKAATEFEQPESVPQKSSFEMQLGTFWLVRVGIVILVTGLAFGANLAYHNIVPRLGPGAKISLLYFASALLLGFGAWWQRRNVKESLQNYAQVVFAGGLAAVYFTTFAAHYAVPVRVITSPLVDGVLLLVWAGVIAWIADRRKSEVMALFAVGLGFFTSVMIRVGEFTLYSNLLLTVAAVWFLVRNRWTTLSFASLITTYVGYAFWRFLHPNGWHWASPSENLGLGAAFLACYWLVFTAATFLSRSEKLSGKSRAAFLTINNGAYFSLFLLTMIQVHTGGFWKFSMIYGSVLLVASGLARKLLPTEPLTKNSYLVHGLVLVTLGFICRFAGLKLALVLGAESVVLYILGTQRGSLWLKIFAYGAALLATGWCAGTYQYFNQRDLWMSLGLGALLYCNAGWAQWQEMKSKAAPTRLEPTVFALLAFFSWTLAGWYNTEEPHLFVAMVLGVESVVFYFIIGGHTITLPKVVAFVSAACAAGWCVSGVGRFDAFGLLTGTACGMLMLLNTSRAHRRAKDDPQPLRTEPAAFTVLAFAPWLVATWQNTTGAHLPLVLVAEALVFTFSFYALRIREITLLGQSFLVLGQVMRLAHFASVTPPWWNPLLMIVATIGLSHWWQHQKVLAVKRVVYHGCATIFALASVAMVLVWLHPLLSPPAWLVFTSLLAMAVTIYGLATRFWALAVCGQIFLGVSVWAFFAELAEHQPEWYCPLVPLATLLAFSLATIAWAARASKDRSAGTVRAPLLQIAMVYRWLALVMSLVWIWDYVPERQRVWAYMLASVVVFGLSIWRASREALIATAIYVAASLTMLWVRDNLVMDIYSPNALSLLALFVMQHILRRQAARVAIEDTTHGTIVMVAGVSLWRFVSCWAALHNNGLSITMVWAGYALVAFTAGMLLRERFLRWFGLGVLAVSVGRIILVDVWKQETGYRVLTFIALGIALLVVGFIYNKYQEKIRQWL